MVQFRTVPVPAGGRKTLVQLRSVRVPAGGRKRESPVPIRAGGGRKMVGAGAIGVGA